MTSTCYSCTLPSSVMNWLRLGLNSTMGLWESLRSVPNMNLDASTVFTLHDTPEARLAFSSLLNISSEEKIDMSSLLKSRRRYRNEPEIIGATWLDPTIAILCF
jgi:hypothetical protein